MIDELELAARYSIVPNSFGYCGGSGFFNSFKRYRKGQINRNEMISELKKFKGLYCYLKTIARVNNKKPFDRSVLEAFWIGNHLLKNVKQKDIILLIRDLHNHAGMDKKRANFAVLNLPKGILIHHSFNSLYLNFVGTKVARTIKNFDKCRIGWGKAISITKNYCILEYRPIEKSNSQYFLGKPKMRKFKRYVSGILLEPELKIGDVVSTHWSAVVQKLNSKQLFCLKKSTAINFCHINTF